MRIDAQSPFVWRQINQQIKDTLQCESNVFLYRGVHQALFEILLGLHLRFSNKKKVVTELGMGDHLTRAEMELAKMGVRFKDSFEQDMKAEEKNTLAYIHDIDDSLTAGLYNHIELLKKLAGTKIYRVHVAHHLFHYRKAFVKKLSDYDIIVVSLNADYALVFTGEKIVLPHLIVGQLNWSFEHDGNMVLQMIKKDKATYHKEITQFEASLPQGVTPWFPAGNEQRIFDRAALVLKDHDGSAMMDLLLSHLDFKKQGLGEMGSIEAASLCRWQNESWFEQAERFGRSKEDMRGLLFIDGSLIDGQFPSLFESCLNYLQNLSTAVSP